MALSLPVNGICVAMDPTTQANQLANLGCQERVQGGFFTALVDDDSSG